MTNDGQKGSTQGVTNRLPPVPTIRQSKRTVSEYGAYSARCCNLQVKMPLACKTQYMHHANLFQRLDVSLMYYPHCILYVKFDDML